MEVGFNLIGTLTMIILYCVIGNIIYQDLTNATKEVGIGNYVSYIIALFLITITFASIWI